MRGPGSCHPPLLIKETKGGDNFLETAPEKGNETPQKRSDACACAQLAIAGTAKYSARDAEALDLELLGELPEYCKDWPYSLRVAYACIRNVRGPAGELNVWVAQLGFGRTQAEKNRILLNMAKALSMAKSANPDD